LNTPGSEQASTLAEMALAAGGPHTALRALHELALEGDAPGAHTISHDRLRGAAIEIAAGLMSLGLERGQTVAILAGTRAEWTLFDLGAMCAGGVLTPIYHTSSAPECAYQLEHSQARIVLCETPDDCAKVRSVAARVPTLEHVLILEGQAHGATPLSELIASGRQAVSEEQVRRRAAEVRSEDLASIVYTSGTTGRPKGCELTHRNILATVAMYRQRLELRQGEAVIYMFLPLAHVLARVASLVAVDAGGTLVFWSGDTHKLVEELALARPTHFVAVPRVYEKIRASVLDRVEERGRAAKLLFGWAQEVGRRAAVSSRVNPAQGPISRLRLAAARRMGLTAVKELFGGRLQFALVGAAPCEARLLQFFDACGVLVLEGYGMTESCAAATLNTLDRPRFGTAGSALAGTAVKIAQDGEVLLAGPNVFAGYHRNPQATEQTMVDGWLATGDLGLLTPEGDLVLTGRKKELIVTSSGKNIGPSEIENGLRESRWISEAVVYGDRKPYLVAMLTLDADELPALRRKLGVDDLELPALAGDERVQKLLWEDVEHNNERFARIEQVKRFGVLPHELSLQAGELTPTLKVRRTVIYERYASFFAQLYEQAAEPDGEVR
jgi:long-chain acyl-CoA synthetase